MHCPFCNHVETKVIDSRLAGEGSQIRRRRECLKCSERFTTFETADLVMPQGVDFSARDVYDGISIRIVRQYDINNDKFPCRLDVLCDYKTLRPQLACRIATLA